MNRTFLALILGASVLAGCSKPKHTLSLLVATDLVPDVQFSYVEATVERPSAVGDVNLHVQVPAMVGQSYAGGQMVGTFPMLNPGDVRMTVRLLRADQSVLIERNVQVSLSADFSLLVHLTSDCVGVMCPDATSDANATACLAGRCVDPRCVPPSTEFCDDYQLCEIDDDCPSTSPCTTGVCTSGVCESEASTAVTCDEGEYCDAQLGCTSLVCDEASLLCGGVCAPCPAIGTAEVECGAAGTCTPTACENGYGLVGGSCVFDGDIGYEQYLKATNTGASDHFGWSMALSEDGNVLAVGAPGESSATTTINGDQENNAAPGSGAVYIFTQDASGWHASAYIKASNAQAQDAFGTSVALSGDGRILYVGAPGEDSGAREVDGDEADNSAQDSGAVYVFHRSDVAWSQYAYVKASNADAGDAFGTSISAEARGEQFVVGAPGEGSAAGSASPNESDNSAAGAGAAYLFEIVAGNFDSPPVQTFYMKSAEPLEGAEFGASVALAGDGGRVVVGAPRDRYLGLSIRCGTVDIFVRALPEPGEPWSWGVPEAHFGFFGVCTSEARFGQSVAASYSGTVVAVGVPHDSSGGAGLDVDQTTQSHHSGGAWIYSTRGSFWAGDIFFKAIGSADPEDEFGTHVSLSSAGNVVAVSAIGEASRALGLDGDFDDNSAAGSGAAYTYVLAAGEWEEDHYIKATNTDAGDRFGSAVCVSADGEAVALSAIGESSEARGVSIATMNNGAPESGAVYVVRRQDAMSGSSP